MKLHLSILEKLIELPTTNPQELRLILDELGLEVKDLLMEGARAVFNIETLANRGDHLSALGIAREFAARDLRAVKFPSLAAPFADRKCSVPVRVQTDRCLRYALLEATLPKGMRVRPDVAQVVGDSDKPAIVDLSNYVLLEMGQPTHAFDREKIEGEIVVEQLAEPAEIQALDGKSYTVPTSAIVIKDKKKIVAVAGVIGCANSMCTDDTTRVLIESAAFDPISVRKTARAMGLSTDASYTFERGSDVEAVIPALRRLAHLAEGSGGAVADQGAAHVLGCTLIEGAPTERRRVVLRLSALREQLHAPRLAEGEVLGRLKAMGYQLEPRKEGDGWQVAVPSWRLWDTKSEEDLIEDFARVHGLNKIRLELPPLDSTTPTPSPLEVLRSKIETPLLGNGFFEVMTRSFYTGSDVRFLEELQPQSERMHITIQNALDRGYSHLKITNVLHLARLLEANARHGLTGAKVFEIGRLFSPAYRNDEYPFEKEVLTLGSFGRWNEGEFRKGETLEERVLLFRGVVDSIVKSCGGYPSVGESKHPLLHPGMQGSMKSGRSIVGFFGVLHPRFKQFMDTRHEFLYAELDTAGLLRSGAARSVTMPSLFPAIKRDLTFVVDLRELAERVVRYIEEAKPTDLVEVMVVDDFRKGDEPVRRLSLRLSFQSVERTLESVAVDDTVQKLLATLNERHGLRLAV